jgi:hypothetical protein
MLKTRTRTTERGHALGHARVAIQILNRGSKSLSFFLARAQLDPNLKRPWSEEEERKLVASQMKIPGRFTDISKYFHLRSDIALEMHWNEILQSRHDEVARHVTDQVGPCSVLVPFLGHRAKHPRMLWELPTK